MNDPPRTTPIRCKLGSGFSFLASGWVWICGGRVWICESNPEDEGGYIYIFVDLNSGCVQTPGRVPVLVALPNISLFVAPTKKAWGRLKV